MISVVCTCGKRLKAEDRHAGKQAKCPNCGAHARFPDPAPPAFEAIQKDDLSGLVDPNGSAKPASLDELPPPPPPSRPRVPLRFHATRRRGFPTLAAIQHGRATPDDLRDWLEHEPWHSRVLEGMATVGIQLTTMLFVIAFAAFVFTVAAGEGGNARIVSMIVLYLLGVLLTTAFVGGLVLLAVNAVRQLRGIRASRR